MKKIVLAGMMLIVPVQVQASITLSTAFLAISAIVSLGNWGKNLVWPKEGWLIEKKAPSQPAAKDSSSAKISDQKDIAMDPLSYEQEQVLTDLMNGSSAGDHPNKAGSELKKQQ